MPRPLPTAAPVERPEWLDCDELLPLAAAAAVPVDELLEDEPVVVAELEAGDDELELEDEEEGGGF